MGSQHRSRAGEQIAILMAVALLLVILVGLFAAGAWWLVSTRELAMREVAMAERQARMAADRARVAAQQQHEQLLESRASLRSAQDRDAGAADLPVCRWLVGTWKEAAAASPRELTWTPPVEQLMLGLQRGRNDANQPYYIYLRIEAEGDSVRLYWHQLPEPEQVYDLAEHTETKLVFQREQQQVVFRREGDQLEVRDPGSQPNPWTATRAGAAQRPQS